MLVRDKPALLELLRRARAKGLAGKHAPIVLKRHGETREAVTVAEAARDADQELRL